MSAAVSASRLAVSTFSVTTSQVIIGPMYLPFWSIIALTLSSKSSGPTLIVARARQVPRVGQEPPLVLGRLVEHVDRVADHLVDLDRQVRLEPLERLLGLRVHVLDLQVEVGVHHVDRRVVDHLLDPVQVALSGQLGDLVRGEPADDAAAHRAAPEKSPRDCVEKKSSVPTTWPSRITGRATAVLIPARRASGARQQSCSSPRSATWNRSRSRQDRPLSPSPSRNRAVRVSRWNSSSTRPDSSEKTSAFSTGSTVQYDA